MPRLTLVLMLMMALVLSACATSKDEKITVGLETPQYPNLKLLFRHGRVIEPKAKPFNVDPKSAKNICYAVERVSKSGWIGLLMEENCPSSGVSSTVQMVYAVNKAQPSTNRFSVTSKAIKTALSQGNLCPGAQFGRDMTLTFADTSNPSQSELEPLLQMVTGAYPTGYIYAFVMSRQIWYELAKLEGYPDDHQWRALKQKLQSPNLDYFYLHYLGLEMMTGALDQIVVGAIPQRNVTPPPSDACAQITD